jgi:LmbE family N-acetylglucosaminyl deacetylase
MPIGAILPLVRVAPYNVRIDAEVTMTSRVLLLSPHPDDVAWSLGGTLARLGAAGTEVWTLTFFTRSVYAPGSWATDIDQVTAVRAAEERAWAAAHGVRLLRGDLPDSGLRGYDDLTELGAVPEPEVVAAAGRLLAGVVDRSGADAVLVPGSRGGHVDHAAVRLAAAARPDGPPVLHYDDLPYAVQLPPPGGGHQVLVDLAELWPAKEAGMRHFPSQCWEETLPIVRAYAATVGGERLWTDSPAGADLLRRLTGTAVPLEAAR